MLLNFLEQLNLSRGEIEIYELLLRIGQAPAHRIVAETKLKRPTAYKFLNELEKKGLVVKEDKDKIIHFRPESPTKLMELAENNYRSLDHLRNNLASLMPQLTSTYILSVEKPVVTTFEGIEGLKQIYEDTLECEGEIYNVLQTAQVEEELKQWLEGVYVKRRAKRGVYVKAIVTSGKGTKVYTGKDKKELRTTIVVSQELFPFQHEVAIYGDKVAFINFKKGEPLIGVVINHPQIAKTMRAMFDLAWVGATSQVDSKTIKNS